MHSSGRGEESPEAYRGVVLPSAQAQQAPPYGDQVQPAGGTPWGAPVPTPHPSAPPQPEPADATQMLPPYPAAMPAPGDPVPGGPGSLHPGPVADATQMLPPYPGGEPVAPSAPQQAVTPGPVPPLPPVPPQAPPQVAQPSAPAGPAEATQALPLSVFQEQQQSYEASYEPPSYEQQPSYEQAYPNEQAYPQPPYGQEYGGYRQAQQSQESQQEQGPQHDSDYDHLFRSDVPSPPPLRQRIIQPPSPQQAAQQQGPGQPPYGQGAGRPPYGQQGYEPGYAYDDGDGSGGRKMSPKVLIGIVVAGCVVAGLVVGGLLNSGGSASADNADPQNTSPAATASASASGTGTTAVDSEAKRQAQALDALLNTSGNSRSSVVHAVESIKNCTDLPGAASALRAAAGQRNGLVTQLGALSVDKLPAHADLTDALTKAWQASAAADAHYANWADQAQQNRKICKGGHARGTGETEAGNRESGTATQQKKRAVRLWNTIAEQYGLTKRQYSQL